MYTFPEPDTTTLITEVTLVREGGRLSEQTFGVALVFEGFFSEDVNAATLELDYSIKNSTDNSISATFPAEAQNITVNFRLFGDSLPEGLEAFRVTPFQIISGFPNFHPGSVTEIEILDNDCKFFKSAWKIS